MICTVSTLFATLTKVMSTILNVSSFAFGISSGGTSNAMSVAGPLPGEMDSENATTSLSSSTAEPCCERLGTLWEIVIPEAGRPVARYGQSSREGVELGQSTSNRTHTRDISKPICVACAALTLLCHHTQLKRPNGRRRGDQLHTEHALGCNKQRREHDIGAALKRE